MNKKGGFQELLFTVIMPKLYGIGASVVIVGAMFKILHLPGGTSMLGIGLSTEAVIFFLSAFEPKHRDPDWARVYPELSDDFQDDSSPSRVARKSVGIAGQMDKVMAEAKIGPELLKGLGDGMRNVAETARRMAALGNVTVATNEYAVNVKNAAKTISQMNQSCNYALQGMKDMTEATRDAKEYRTQMQNVTKSLSTLNALYEMELKDANNHTKALNRFYSNMTQALEGMAKTSEETHSFQNALNGLTSNIAALNKVYGGMLSAMKA